MSLRNPSFSPRGYEPRRSYGSSAFGAGRRHHRVHPSGMPPAPNRCAIPTVRHAPRPLQTSSRKAEKGGLGLLWIHNSRKGTLFRDWVLGIRHSLKNITLILFLISIHPSPHTHMVIQRLTMKASLLNPSRK